MLYEHIPVPFCHKVNHLTAGAHDGIVGRAGPKSSLSTIPEFKSRLGNLLAVNLGDIPTHSKLISKMKIIIHNHWAVVLKDKIFFIYLYGD